MVKNDNQVAFNLINQNLKNFRDFRVFVFSPIAKNENSEISEILEKLQNFALNLGAFQSTLKTTKSHQNEIR